MSEAKQNLDKAAREFEQWIRDELHKPVSPPVEHEQPAPEGEEWRYREGSGVIYEVAVPTKVIARYVDADVATQIITDHALVLKLTEALEGVEQMLDVELARDYESQLWAKQVRAALMSVRQLNAVAKERENALADKS